MKRLLVVGASGDVGQGIVEAAVAAEWHVVAAARNPEKLERLGAVHGVATMCGDLATEAGAAALWEQACAIAGEIDAVVVAVNAPNLVRPLMDWSAEDLSAVLEANLLTHFVAAKTFIPRLPQHGVYVGIGGGTADFVIPKLGQVSIAQAALRMMYRALAREQQPGGPAVRELMIVSMVNGESKRERADPAWVTDVEVGRHVCAVLAEPALFPGSVIRLESREQVGRPEIAAA